MYVCVRACFEDVSWSNTQIAVFTVEDLVSSDIEELAQKCSVSYKVFIPYIN